MATVARDPDPDTTPGAAARPARYRVPELTRASPYSYTCRACSRCCHNYDIKVNPYEVAALARHLSTSTTEFGARHTANGPFLRRTSAGACEFLGQQGCTVHGARPLVCRLYPLGLEQTREHGERFFHMHPHPQTAGTYGTDGTVGDFLNSQGAAPYLEASDRYGEVLGEMLAALRARPDAAVEFGGVAAELEQVREQPVHGPSEWLDPDHVLAVAFPGLDVAALSPARTMELHIAVLRQWITRLNEETDDEQRSNED